MRLNYYIRMHLSHFILPGVRRVWPSSSWSSRIPNDSLTSIPPTLSGHPLLHLLARVFLDPPRLDSSVGLPCSPSSMLYPHFLGLITVEGGDGKGISGWEALGSFWSRTRSAYMGRWQGLPGEGEPNLSGGWEGVFILHCIVFKKRI